MAKDDFHVIVYQILAYLYHCLKNDVDVDTKMLSADSPYFIVHSKPLSNRYWCQYAKKLCPVDTGNLRNWLTARNLTWK